MAAKLVARGEQADRAQERAAALVEAMRSRFSAALTTGWQSLEGTFGLPDRDDEHVLAAAVTADAATVVTDNLRDFPAHLMPAGTAALTPARFAAAVIEPDPARAAGAVAAMAARSGRHGPHLTAGEILDVLARRYAMDEAAHLVRPHLRRQPPASRTCATPSRQVPLEQAADFGTNLTTKADSGGKGVHGRNSSCLSGCLPRQ